MDDGLSGPCLVGVRAENDDMIVDSTVSVSFCRVHHDPLTYAERKTCGLFRYLREESR